MYWFNIQVTSCTQMGERCVSKAETDNNSVNWATSLHDNTRNKRVIMCVFSKCTWFSNQQSSKLDGKLSHFMIDARGGEWFIKCLTSIFSWMFMSTMKKSCRQPSSFEICYCSFTLIFLFEMLHWGLFKIQKSCFWNWKNVLFPIWSPQIWIYWTLGLLVYVQITIQVSIYYYYL